MSTQPEQEGAVGGVTTALNNLALSNDDADASSLYGGLKKPRVDWTQDEKSITLIVNISDLKEYVAQTGGETAFSSSTISFMSKLPLGYGFQLKLLGSVLTLQPTNEKLLGQSLRITLNKLSPGYRWPYLTATKENLRWLKPLATNGIEFDEEDDMLKIETMTRYMSNLLGTDVKDGNAKVRASFGGGGESSSDDEDDSYSSADEDLDQ